MGVFKTCGWLDHPAGNLASGSPHIWTGLTYEMDHPAGGQDGKR
jgi:hypothetical protein